MTTRRNSGMGISKHYLSGTNPKSPKLKYNMRLAAEGTGGKHNEPRTKDNAKVRAKKWKLKRKNKS